jgi:hypothetical protein
MPNHLFISYKRGTAAIAPLMAELRSAGYRLWFDRDEIHLGDPDWQARIDRGLEHCDGVILGLTPAACASEPVQYKIKKASALGKPIFPLLLERLSRIPLWTEFAPLVSNTATYIRSNHLLSCGDRAASFNAQADRDV